MAAGSVGWLRAARTALLGGVFVLMFGQDALATKTAPTTRHYSVNYSATLNPSTGRAKVTISLHQPRQLVRRIEFVAPEERYLNVQGQGTVERSAQNIVWVPPARGGALEYEFVIDRKRDNGVADARITDSWALFKLDHLFPRTAVRFVRGATSRATLDLVAPKGWSIETPYGPAAGHRLLVDDAGLNFDRPRGWLLAGKLAVRRDALDDHLISVATPSGSGLRANDMLSFVRWNQPALLALFPNFPRRLLIISAPEGMWRGGLSGVNSLYVQLDRPFISGNRTSTLLHEIVHAASGLHGATGADWIVEGLAEYYSITLLKRSGGISDIRYEQSFDTLAEWSRDTRCVATDRSQGPQTARAALVMHALDREIRHATNDEASLDQLTQMLVKANKRVTNAAFRAGAEALIGGPAKALQDCP